MSSISSENVQMSLSEPKSKASRSLNLRSQPMMMEKIHCQENIQRPEHQKKYMNMGQVSIVRVILLLVKYMLKKRNFEPNIINIPTSMIPKEKPIRMENEVEPLIHEHITTTTCTKVTNKSNKKFYHIFSLR